MLLLKESVFFAFFASSSLRLLREIPFHTENNAKIISALDLHCHNKNFSVS